MFFRTKISAILGMSFWCASLLSGEKLQYANDLSTQEKIELLQQNARDSLAKSEIHNVEVVLENIREGRLIDASEYAEVSMLVNRTVKMIKNSPDAKKVKTPLVIKLRVSPNGKSERGLFYFEKISGAKVEGLYVATIPVGWKTYFTKRPKTTWVKFFISDWLSPQLVDSWIKQAVYQFPAVKYSVVDDWAINYRKLEGHFKNLKKHICPNIEIELGKSIEKDLDLPIAQHYARFFQSKTQLELICSLVANEKVVDLTGKQWRIVLHRGSSAPKVDEKGKIHFYLDNDQMQLKTKLIVQSLNIYRPNFDPKKTLLKKEQSIEHYALWLARELNDGNIIYHMSHFDDYDISTVDEFDSLLDIVESIAVRIGIERHISEDFKKVFDRGYVSMRIIPNYPVFPHKVVIERNFKTDRGPKGSTVIDYFIDSGYARYNEESVGKEKLVDFIYRALYWPKQQLRYTK